MDKQELIERLTLGGFAVSDESRMGNGHGCHIRLTTGAIVCLYDTGKIVVQGKNQEPVKALLGVGDVPAARSVSTTQAASRNVFVVYGHDDPARTELEAMLRRWGLEPLILDQLPSAGQTIIEKLESVRRDATFAARHRGPHDDPHRLVWPILRALFGPGKTSCLN
jgi:predicted nucleotide-binding protein